MGLLFLLTLVLCKVIFFDGNVMTAAADDSMSFGAAVELAVAMPLSWLPLISDYTREAKEPVKATAVSAIVYGLVSCWMYVIGMGAAIFTGESDIAQILLKAGLSIVGLLIIVFSTVTTTFLDAYSAGISSESIVSTIKGKYAAIAVTVIGTLGAILFPMDDILHRDKREDSFDWRNLIIWAAGFILYRALMHIDLPVGNTLPDMVITSAICVIVGKIGKKK